MKEMRRKLAVCATLGILAVLGAACTSTTQQANLRGDFAGTAQTAKSNEIDYAAIEMHEVYSVCESLLKVRVFDRFHECYQHLEQRVAANKGGFVYYLPALAITFGDEDIHTMNREWSTAHVTVLRAKAHFFAGDLEAAKNDAETIINAVDSGPFLTRKMQENAGGILYKLGGNPDDLVGIKNYFRVDALGMLATIENEWGDSQSVEERISAMTDLDLSGSDNEAAFSARANWLARTYLQSGQPEEAYAAMIKVREKDFGDFLFGAVRVLNVVNPVYYAASLEMTGTLDFVSAMEFRSSFEPRFMLHLAELESGRIAQAKAGYDEILNEPKVKGFGSVYWRALHGRGRIAVAENDRSAAIDYFKQAIEVIESQRRSIDSEAGRMSFVGDKQEVYSDLIGVLIDTGRAGEAFAYSERGKARALVDILASKESFGDAAVRPREAALLKSYQAQEARLKQQARKQGSDITTRSANARADLIAEAPELASLVTVTALSAEELQSLIPAGETIVEYYRERDRLFAFVADRDSVEAFELSTEGVDESVSRFRRALSRPGNDAWRAPGRTLYERLIEPISGAVAGRDVTIVPHGALHYVPFAAIPLRDGSFLMERWDISVLPSVSVLKFIGGKQSGQRLLVMGNPDLGDPKLDLPGAQAEAVAISKSTPGAETLLRGNATETALRQRAGSHDVLHLASHGVFDPSNPLSSALLLSSDGKNDGRLTASEIYELKLDASLVTLSACQTGLGRVQSGDDVVGLTRGFLFSGADAIVASLWLVDDAATSELMTAFYRARPKMGTRSALKHAQQTLIRNGKVHPYYWAAFQLTGSESRMVGS